MLPSFAISTDSMRKSNSKSQTETNSNDKKNSKPVSQGVEQAQFGTVFISKTNDNLIDSM